MRRTLIGAGIGAVVGLLALAGFGAWAGYAHGSEWVAGPAPPPEQSAVTWAFIFTAYYWWLMAAVLVLARFCEPSSELHIAEDWFRRTALGDLLGIADDKVNDDRLYRALDQVLPQKVLLEFHLKHRLGDLFGLEYDLLLYDITSTYFEGEAAANPQARRGHSRDHRRDCKQVLIGLVVTRDGYPLGYEVFAGNRHDSTTLQEIVKRMEAFYGRNGRIWVLDRGMVSEANLTWLKERGSRYIVGTPRSRLKQFARAVRRGDWELLREGLEVQRCPDDASVETFILCRSAVRAVKEQAMRERFVTRISVGLRKIRAACRRQRCAVGKIERRVGRLLGQNSRAARLFRVKVEERPDGGACLLWSRRSGARAWAESSQGCYLLRSNVANWDAEELWRAYMHLTDAEAAFRVHKTDLCIRPVWHQTAGRVQAHLLVCFLAYVLRKTLEGWMARAGLGNSPTTVLEELGPHSERRRSSAHDGRADHSFALCGPSRQGPVHPVEPLRIEAAAASETAGGNVSQVAKCSANFSARNAENTGISYISLR
jgi:transposase